MIDKKIINRCIKGDRNSQKALFLAYAQKMFVHCYRYVNNKEDAEEIVSEGFIKMFQNLSRLEFKGVKSFEAWIKRIMINECLAHLRRKQKMRFGELKSEDVEGFSEIDAELNSKDIYNAILGLPQGYRTVFNLYVVEGYSHKEIAHKLGIMESTSRSQLTKARNMLKTIIKNRYP